MFRLFRLFRFLVVMAVPVFLAFLGALDLIMPPIPCAYDPYGDTFCLVYVVK
jgi:hypothetical protein